MLSLKKIPKKWEEVKFQDHIVKTFKGAVAKKEYPHVVLLKGPSGTGKTSLAKIYAAYLRCSSPVEGNPCGKCQSCTSIFGGENLPNLYYVNGRQEGGVAFYRDFISSLQEKASLFNPKKIVIIDEAHGLSTDALEVLLTPLENPTNNHLYVILCTTEGLKIPKSLQSRSLSFMVARPDDLDLAKYLNEVISQEKWKVSEDFCVDGVLRIIDSTEGNIRECLNVLWNLYLADDFSEESVQKNLVVNGDIWVSDVVKKILEGKSNTVLSDMDTLLNNISVSEFFKRLFNEVFNVYRFKVLGVPLKSSFQENHINKNYGRIPVSRVSSLTSLLVDLKKLFIYEMDKNVLFYYLAEFSTKLNKG